MHPYRGIVRKDRVSYGISTIPEDFNTLTQQSSGKNDTPWDPLHGPVTCNPARTRPGSTLHLYPWYRHLLQRHGRHGNSAAASPANWRVRYTTLVSSSASEAVSEGNRSTIYDSTEHAVFDSIWLTFKIFIFNSSHIICDPFQSSFREFHIWQGVLQIILR